MLVAGERARTRCAEHEIKHARCGQASFEIDVMVASELTAPAGRARGRVRALWAGSDFSLHCDMDDLPKNQMAQLRAETQESRYQFLKMELLTSFTAIDFGNTALELGEREGAAREARSAEKGYATILRFLPGVESLERRNEVEASLLLLRQSLDALRHKLAK